MVINTEFILWAIQQYIVMGIVSGLSIGTGMLLTGYAAERKWHMLFKTAIIWPLNIYVYTKYLLLGDEQDDGA